jgi:pimeloyl-ACP methyl ester carboxylesterase
MRFEIWDKVSSQLESSYRLLLFNRLGVGLSQKADRPQDGNAVVDEMRCLFRSLDLQQPVLLVAHSLGGLYVNLYVRKYPNEVAGVVLVDSPHPSEVEMQRLFKPPLILHAFNRLSKVIEKRFDPYRYSEDEYSDHAIRQISQAGAFPDIPLAVVSGIKKMLFVPNAAHEIHQSYQSRLLELSKKSRRYLCYGSGHFPQVTEPAIVIEAIEQTLRRIQDK